MRQSKEHSGGSRGRGSLGEKLFLLIATVALLAVVVIPAAAIEDGTRNGRIAFAAGDNQLCSVRPDGTRRVRITTRGRNVTPQWSPDGERLVFACKRPNMPPRICVSRANGDPIRFVTDRSSVADDPAWSPNGKEILFARSAGANGLAGDYLIRKVLRTGVETEVLYMPQYISGPRWSPDGTTVLFGSSGVGVRRDIFSASIDGSEVENLTMSTQSEGTADWHPDGTTIAFDRFVRGASVEEDRWNVFVMNADGTDVRPTGVSGNAPSWSPDGTRLATYDLVDLNDSIFLTEADGDARTRLTPPRLDAVQPDWRPAR